MNDKPVFTNTPTGMIDQSLVALPERDFRGAWRVDAEVPAIDIDMPTARDIKRNGLRMDREPMFKVIDLEASILMRQQSGGATLSPANKTTINAGIDAAQKLRDAPAHPSIEAANNTNDLDTININTVTA